PGPVSSLLKTRKAAPGGGFACVLHVIEAAYEGDHHQRVQRLNISRMVRRPKVAVNALDEGRIRER
ncbi:MAG: hypothetical protein ACJ8DJ_08880, partial [Gemmatimonadales bacterium]